MDNDCANIEMLEVYKSTDTSPNINVVSATSCCNNDALDVEKSKSSLTETDDQTDGRRRRHVSNERTSYAASRNVAEGMMDIALLSANANQLRFLITYNFDSSTFYISLGLIVLSLVMQVSVGIALIFKRRMYKCSNKKKINQTNEFVIGGVFIITVINILLAAFTTTDNKVSLKNEHNGNRNHN